MPCLCGDDREDQRYEALSQSKKSSSEEVSNSCGEDEPQPLRVEPPRLLRLDVERAVAVDATHFWEAVNDVERIRVIAVTDPPDTVPVWTPGNLGAGENGNVKLVSRAATGTITVTATLDVTRSVEIKIYDLTDMTCPLPAHGGGGHRWKAYVSGNTTVLTAVTVPNTNEVWPLVVWTEGVPRNPVNPQAVALTPEGDPEITASLGRIAPKTVSGVLHLCQWPTLQVAEVTFGGWPVENDTTGNFDQRWERGRLDHLQSPLCYAYGDRIQLLATFNVTQHPTDTEKVRVRGRANLNGTTLEWASVDPHIDVTHAAATVDLALTTSDNPIPDGVRCYDPMTIDWEMTDQNGNWVEIERTSNVLYATLGAPNGTPAYWTLLDVSCRAAPGVTDADALVAGFYPRFAAGRGTGNGIVRKRDGTPLSYWLQAYDNAEVFTTAQLLASADGSGRCGSWADFMMDMCKVHGVLTAVPYDVITAQNPNAGPLLRRRAGAPEYFLVKHHQFNGGGTLAQPLPYVGGTECVKQDGAWGQGWNNPLALFGDHGMVEYGGQIYDPSYGSGPFASHKLWEDASLDGLGNGNLSLYPYAGVRHLMAAVCSPGFLIHPVAGGETMDDIAAAYGVADGNTLFNHAINAPLRAIRATAAVVQDGDTVYIPRAISTIEILQRV